LNSLGKQDHPCQRKRPSPAQDLLFIFSSIAGCVIPGVAGLNTLLTEESVMFAEVMLAPGGIIAWLLVGLIAGWLAGLFMQGSGYGIAMDIVLGLIGAFIGGLVFSILVQGEAGFWGSVGIAFVGACILVAIVHAIAPNRSI
jgi:uncharacterized membrane protein YeaQ/YmgE (transglycosylase-associated protein family)